MTDPAFIDAYRGVVCDLDGVVYRGDDAVPGAPEALQQMLARGVGVVYATNNASRVPADVARQLSDIGAPGGPDDVVTSARAGAERLASELPAGAPVLALGGPGVPDALSRAGLQPVAPGETQGPSARAVSAVLQGFGRELTVGDLEAGARVLAGGARWVATNDDATLPLPWGAAPGNGAYVELLAGALGRRPVVVGKPHAPLYRLATARLGVAPGEVLAVGDRLDTDIAGARAAGTGSAWVLTGVDAPSRLLASDLQPDVVVRQLADLLGPLPAVTREGEVWSCGLARVRLHDGDLEVVDAGRPADLLRAGVAALVAGRDEGAPSQGLSRAAARLDALADGHPLA